MDLEVDTEDPSGPVRIVSPKLKVEEEKAEDKDFDPDSSKPGDTGNQVLQFSADSEASSLVNQEMEDCLRSIDMEVNTEYNIISSLKGISSFSGFLEHLDKQLNNVEAELITVLNVSTLILNTKEKPKNLKVQQAMELLESVRGLRGR